MIVCLLLTVVIWWVKEGFILVIGDKLALFVDYGEFVSYELWGSNSNFIPLKNLLCLLTVVICKSWKRVHFKVRS